MAQVTTKSPIARALKRVLDDDTNTFSAMEMADVAECSERHIYKVVDLTETTELSAPKVAKINKYLTRHGEYRLLYAQMDTDLRVVQAMEGESTGTCTDDVMDIIKDATGIDDAYEHEDWDECRRFLNDIRHELADLETEISRAQGRQ